MDPNIDVNSILVFPSTRSEWHHKSRDRHSYHVFSSYFYHQSKELSYYLKVCALRTEGVWASEVFDVDDSSFDSFDIVEAVKYQHTMKLIGIRRCKLSGDQKMAWCDRETDLNNRLRTDSKFLHILPSLLVPSLMDNLLHSLTKDWQVVVSYFLSAIRRKPKNGNSPKTYKFGRERAIL